MAVDDALLITSFDNHLKEIADAVSERNVILWKLKRAPGAFKTGMGGYKKITWKVLTGDDPSVSSFSFYDSLQIPTHNPFVEASEGWAGYHGGIVLSKWERMINSHNPTQILNLYDEKVRNLRRTLMKTIGQHLYSSGGAKDVKGLEDMIDDTGTYAGIDRSTVTEFQANKRSVSGNFYDDDDGDGVANGVETMRQLWMDCSHGSGGIRSTGPDNLPGENESPDLLITTQSGWMNYEQELVPQQRYTDEEMAQAGFQNILFSNSPLVWDRNCTADTLYMLNSDMMQFWVVGNDLVELAEADETWSPHAFVLTYLGIFQFVLRNPRYVGKMTGVD